MKDYKPGEYTIQEHVKQCWHLLDIPPYLIKKAEEQHKKNQRLKKQNADNKNT